MPRGVYDRSKLTKKAAPAVEKTKAPAKRGRKLKAVTEAVTVSQAETSCEAASFSSYGPSDNSLFLMQEIRQNIATLSTLQGKFESAALAEEIKAHVTCLSTLRKRVFGASEEPSSANGVGAGPQTTNVPLPAAPVMANLPLT